MPTKAVLLIAALLALPIAALAATAENADVWNGSQINWRDPATGIKEVAETKRPALLIFHAMWCGVCKRYREVFKDKEIVERSKDFVMILVDIDKYSRFNEGMSPDGNYVPRTIFFGPDGKISRQLVGPDPQYPHTIDAGAPDELRMLMRKARSVFNLPAPATENPAPSSEKRS